MDDATCRKIMNTAMELWLHQHGIQAEVIIIDKQQEQRKTI